MNQLKTFLGQNLKEDKVTCVYEEHIFKSNSAVLTMLVSLQQLQYCSQVLNKYDFFSNI